jgi:hypothetical protein
LIAAAGTYDELLPSYSSLFTIESADDDAHGSASGSHTGSPELKSRAVVGAHSRGHAKGKGAWPADSVPFERPVVFHVDEGARQGLLGDLRPAAILTTASSSATVRHAESPALGAQQASEAKRQALEQLELMQLYAPPTPTWHADDEEEHDRAAMSPAAMVRTASAERTATGSASNTPRLNGQRAPGSASPALGPQTPPQKPQLTPGTMMRHLVSSASMMNVSLAADQQDLRDLRSASSASAAAGHSGLPVSLTKLALPPPAEISASGAAATPADLAAGDDSGSAEASAAPVPQIGGTASADGSDGKSKGKLMQAEDRKTGRVSGKVYRYYFGSSNWPTMSADEYFSEGNEASERSAEGEKETSAAVVAKVAAPSAASGSAAVSFFVQRPGAVCGHHSVLQPGAGGSHGLRLLAGQVGRRHGPRALRAVLVSGHGAVGDRHGHCCRGPLLALHRRLGAGLASAARAALPPAHARPGAGIL